ncbi:MAG TPA: polysaccharide biosynthesis tyrosine autokinase [Pseudomonadales bacterium]|nr:polysaccharide biosynthesis tyrosine autokinase [Pseudomonadales bacterium]
MNAANDPPDLLMEQEEEEFDLRHYYAVIDREKWGILGLALVSTLLSILVAMNLTPIYRASSILLIENQSGKMASMDELYGRDARGWTYNQTQVNILLSRQLARSVVEHGAIDFSSEVTFNPNLIQPEQPIWESMLPFLAKDRSPMTADAVERHMIRTLRGGLSVESVPRTDMIQIAYESPNAELATRVSNLVAEVYIESQLEARIQLTQKAADWLTARMDTLRQKLSESEAALQAFQEKERLVEFGTSGVRSLSVSELNQVSNDIIVARKARIETERTYQQVVELQSVSREVLMTHPGILVDPGVVASKQTQDIVERKVLELAERYGPKHPKMMAALAEQKAAGQQLNRQIDNAVKRLKEVFDAAVATEANLKRNELSARGDIQGLRRKEFQLAALQRNAETDMQLYNTFFTRFKETNATEGLQAANARIADPAVVPRFPVKPNKRQLVIIVFVLSLMAGVGLAILKDFLDNTIKSGSEVEEKLGMAFLGYVPLVKNKRNDKYRHSQLYLNPDQHSFAEAIRTVRTSMMLSSLDSPHKIIVVTSSIPKEGKTTLTFNLAIAFGQMEKVLLIDADMRMPSVALDSGLTNQHTGLSNYVAGSSPLEECVYPIEAFGLDVMPAGLITPNPLELLSSLRFKDTLTELRSRYDRIIIDSAPCQAVSDSLVLSRSADALIYVVQADSTSRHVITTALKRLRRVGAPIVGIVLNRFDTDNAARYERYSGNVSGYYNYYGGDERVAKS